jgi:uncharacterized protein with von Willebrand factor type A (vWA) domain
MFTGFFYTLKQKKVPVSITEWMTLLEAMDRGCITNLDEFYFLARSILVKSEGHYDHYDMAFQEYFKGIITASAEISDQIKEWLKESLALRRLFEENPELFEKMTLDELLKELEKRLAEQTEQHDGGSHWIGRGGTSPFGHSGYHPAGIRIGGESGGRHAMKIAQERRFRNYASDLTLDVRQMKLALKRLRQLTRTGPEDELDLGKTIDATAKNVGDIELIWRRSRKNTVKLLLLMDVGGSMEPYAMLCSRLFSAAHSSTHFKDFRHYFFHNCIYEDLFTDIQRVEKISTEHVLHTLEPDYKVILVGDARMGSWELLEQYGAIDYYHRNETPGIVWLKRIAEHFTRSVWLNPDDTRYWSHPTVKAISRLFPMYSLTIEGLEQSVKRLIVKR